jgi:5-oxoprolinase (ATP-hydrolysing)
MTNTRLTDPEILERRFPVRVREFAVRRGSGGAGRNRGGDGVVRRLEFLRPLTLSLLTLVRKYGTYVALPGITQIQVEAGDVLEIETPGGGGFGRPKRAT